MQTWPPIEPRVEILDDEPGAEALTEGWDTLAVACGRPFAAPAWALAWWRELAPPGSELRVLAVRDEDDLIGVAAFASQRGALGLTRLVPLGATVAPRVEPLARPGREGDVARALAGALHAMRPRPDLVLLPDLVEGSRWPSLLREAWPRRRPRVLWRRSNRAPTVSLAGRGFDDWVAERSANLRREIRRAQRRVEDAGADFRLSAPSEVEHDLAELARLHRDRWEARGGSKILDEPTERMLGSAVLELARAGRAELRCLDRDGDLLAAQLVVTAGDEAGCWLVGFDEDAAALKPGILVLVRALRHAFERGRARMDLGGGDQQYKYRLADGEEHLAHAYVVLPGVRGLLRRASLAPLELRALLRRVLSDDAKQRIRRRLPERVGERFGMPAP